MISYKAFILPINYDKSSLDYTKIENYKNIVKEVNSLGSAFFWMFDYSKNCFLYLSEPSDVFPDREDAFIEERGYKCMIENVHPDDALFLLDLQKKAIEFIQQKDNKFDYKIVFKMRLLCTGSDYVTHNIQIKLIALDPKGQIWITMSKAVASKSSNYFHPIILNIHNPSDFYHPEVKHAKKQFMHANLSKKETEIIQMLSKNKTSDEICTALQISESTLKHHKSNFMKKLNAKNSVVALENAGLLGLL